MGSLLLLMMIMTMMMVSLSSSHAPGIVTEATAPVRLRAGCPMAKFSWLTDYGRVTICAADSDAALQRLR